MFSLIFVVVGCSYASYNSRFFSTYIYRDACVYVHSLLTMSACKCYTIFSYSFRFVFFFFVFFSSFGIFVATILYKSSLAAFVACMYVCLCFV